MTALQCHTDWQWFDLQDATSTENNRIGPQFYSFSATLKKEVHSLDIMNATLVIPIHFHTSIIYDLMSVHCNQEKKDSKKIYTENS